MEKLENRFEYIENVYDVDNDYWKLKAKYLLEKFDKLGDSISTLKSIKVKNKDIYEQLFSYLLYNNQIEEAETINLDFLNNDQYNSVSILEAREDYRKALDKVREIKNSSDNEYDLNLNVVESFLLLKCNEFKQALSFLQKCLQASNYTEPIFLVNYYIANEKIKGTNKPEKIKEKLLNSLKKHSDIIDVAAYALMKDEKNAYNKLKEVIQSNYSYKYSIKNWIVFEDLFKKDKFKELLS